VTRAIGQPQPDLSLVEDASESFAQHTPVLYEEAMLWLNPRSGGSFIDATVGLGGHAAGILAQSAPRGMLLALDTDAQALELARQRLAPYGDRVLFAQAQHTELAVVARTHGFAQVDGILFDLGVSSLQLNDPGRGFSFQKDGPLDMRMSLGAGITAEEIVNTWSEGELARIIYQYGEEMHARRVARAICQRRPLWRTQELAEVVASVVGSHSRIHPATRTFQALRIAVNEELASLQTVLPQAVELLAPDGRLAVISFHSLEDRIVKQFMTRESTGCICPPKMPQCTCAHVALLERLTKKPVRPTTEEVQHNPRSRSARLRVARRLGPTEGEAT
jgi:16S rRNA (cytosine1402-N4)-methyltransferase